MESSKRYHSKLAGDGIPAIAATSDGRGWRAMVSTRTWSRQELRIGCKGA
jgi:hypothetical protein